ncbi:MAG: hypothetical protein HC822_27105 [Oscillochloris sp.]|nr:hypothetical protein [Oscillochloris sp.]
MRTLLSSYAGRGLALLVVIATIAGALPATAVAEQSADRCYWFNQRYDDFYDPPVLDPAAQPGSLLRVEFVARYTAARVARIADRPNARFGALIYRVLYQSQAPRDSARAVSGLLIVPQGPRPAAGFPLMAYAHGTVGLNDAAAPSRLPTTTAASLMQWVAAGYAVTSSDYVGLGTPGPHPYLVGEAAAFSVLDSVRAALNFCDRPRGVAPAEIANHVIVTGWSQGGHAALFSAELQQQYAPELKIAGVVAYAPAADLSGLLEYLGAPFSAVILPAAAIVYGYNRYYNLLDPLDSLLQEPYASELIERAERQGLLGLLLWLGFRPERVFQPAALAAIRSGDLSPLSPWPELLAENTPGQQAAAAPLLIVQGESDIIVPAATTRNLVQRLCAVGNTVETNYLPDVGHGVVEPAGADVLAWAAARLANRPAASSCAEAARQPQFAAALQNTLARSDDPVILKGAAVPQFSGAATDRIVAYRYLGGAWARVPLQVDEIQAGQYVASEDGKLDSDDEIVVMAGDLGAQAPGQGAAAFEPQIWLDEADLASTPLLAELPVGLTYELEVRDPLDSAAVGYLYLVQVAAPDPTPVDDYVDFNPETSLLVGQNYTLGFATPDNWVDRLTLGTSDSDLLDRTKLRGLCNQQGACFFKEQGLPDVADDLITDGPVRVIVRNGRTIAYGWSVLTETSLNLPGDLVSNLRFTTDFTAAVSGATFYNANLAAGVTVDGSPDNVAETPFSPWWQLSTADGTVIQVSDVSGIGGSAGNYYADDATNDPNDTGDRLRYGDTGITVTNPNSSISYRAGFSFLDGAQPNRGATYAARFDAPLSVTAEPWVSESPDPEPEPEPTAVVFLPYLE